MSAVNRGRGREDRLIEPTEVGEICKINQPKHGSNLKRIFGHNWETKIYRFESFCSKALHMKITKRLL